ncbi:hypothetical protein D9613_009839 [Agrocybe pediades]|uniref:Peptidase C14 caspase domain-containing protein n=1 Tax=Agrocybe pediades TaxID=84607 RepID=A0A8H4QWT1_9AGAR|nr:hypothetical protein D9613_009839 [Agrocybe pediades]
MNHRRPAKISPVQSPLRRKLAKIHEHWARTSIDNVVLNSDSVGSPISSLPVPVPTIQEPAAVISSPMHDAASETASNTNHVKVLLPETFVHQHQQQHQNPCQQQHHQSTGGRSSLSVITDIQRRGFWLTDSYCSSPAELYCTGFCRDPDNSAYMLAGTAMADVISISSAKDGQLSWEDGDGASTLTQSLVRILEKDPHLTFDDLMTLVSHDIHSYYVDLHSRARDYRKKVRLANNEKVKKGQKPRPGKEVEMNNFQNPQLSSERPLDMTRRFYP